MNNDPSATSISPQAASRSANRRGASLRFSARGVSFAGAALLFLLATWVAYTQDPRPDPFAAEPSVASWDYWRYPVERNAFRRLPVVWGELNHVFALPDGKNLWAVGDGGLILHSGDGGRHWEQQKIGEPPAPASEKKSGWVGSAWAGEAEQVGAIPTAKAAGEAGKPGLEKESTTGNRSRRTSAQNEQAPIQTGGPDYKPEGAQPSNSGGGRSAWQTAAESNLESVVFLDPLRGWAVGSEGTILASSDGGKTWNPQTSGTSAWLYSIAMHDDGQRGWAVGSKGAIVASSDGGKTWNPQTSGTSAWLYSIALHDDGQRVWAVGGEGAIVASSDGGKTWSPQTSGTSEWLNSIALHADGQRGWAVGDEGTILASSDGGKTWNRQTSGTRELLNSITFNADGQRGWAVGRNGAIFASNDGGNTWNLQTSGTSEWLNSIALHPDGQRGLAVGHLGTILASSDGGKNWRPQTSGTREWLSSVALHADGQRGWAVGTGGTILASSDGGKTWNPQTSGTRVELNSITLHADGQRVWAVGDEGTILASSDGGKTWNPQTSGTRAPLTSIALHADGQHGLVVGNEGTILSTSDGGKTWTAPEYDRGLPPWYYASLLFCAGLLAPSLRRPPPVDAATPAIEGAMASDRPMQAGDVDVLGLRNIAWALSRFLRNENTEAPLTVAITGEWGTGKSSLMNALREDIVQYGMRPVLFNAWHHQKEEHLLASLLEAVRRQAIPPVTKLLGLLFRVRLVWGRAKRRPFSTLVLFTLALLFAGYLSNGFSVRLTDLAAIASMPDLGDFAKLILAGAAGLSPLIGLLKALKPFGASPAALIANAASGLRQSSAESRTGFRDRFAAEFGEVTQALGARTMLIMIDDLDRCRPDSVLEVMEGINFLVSSGECFVVLGMARERVERAVGLSFREIAREMVLPLDEFGNRTDKEAREREKETRERQARWEYGRHYLEKLINIEIPVPVIRNEQAARLLQARQTDRVTSLWKRGVTGTLQVLAAGVVVLLAAVVFQYGHELPPLKLDTNREDVKSTGTGAAAPSIPPAVSPQIRKDRDDRAKPPQDPRTRPAELIPGQKDGPGWSWMLAGFAMLVISAVVLVLSRPHIVVRDSKSFRDALAIWDEVIASTQNTPRKLKRFMNRLRWLAMRTRKLEPAPGAWGRITQTWDEFRGHAAAEAPGQIPEAVLVGLAAMWAADAVKDKIALELAYATHAAGAGSDPTFGNWPPTPEQMRLLEELSSAVIVS